LFAHFLSGLAPLWTVKWGVHEAVWHERVDQRRLREVAAAAVQLSNAAALFPCSLQAGLKQKCIKRLSLNPPHPSALLRFLCNSMPVCTLCGASRGLGHEMDLHFRNLGFAPRAWAPGTNLANLSTMPAEERSHAECRTDLAYMALAWLSLINNVLASIPRFAAFVLP